MLNNYSDLEKLKRPDKYFSGHHELERKKHGYHT